MQKIPPLDAPQLKGVQKVALFLTLLDRDTVARLGKFFAREEIDKILGAVNSLPAMENVLVKEILEEFSTNYRSVGLISQPDDISGALRDKDNGADSSTQEPQSPKDMELDTASVENDKILKFIHTEPPAIAARLLDALSTERAAEVLADLDGEMRNEIFFAYVQKRKLPSKLESMIGIDLMEMLTGLKEEESNVGSIEKAASIVNQLPEEASENLVDYLKEKTPQIAADISNSIFRFPMFEEFSRETRVIISDVLETSDLSKALVGAEDGLKESVLDVLSPRNRRMVESELQAGANEEQVKAAQSRISKSVLNLIKSGKIEPLSSGEDAGDQDSAS